MSQKLFPTDIPPASWHRFPALGFSENACGVIYRLGSKLTNGMPLGGIDTGCLDLQNTGLLGYCTIFNTHVPRRGPLNLPLFGLSVDGETHMLCVPRTQDGEGGSQQSATGREYNIWKGNGLEKSTEPITPVNLDLDLGDLRTAEEIHYWGHYPIVDMVFETASPLEVSLRAWSPFLPGFLDESMVPGISFTLRLTNRAESPKEVSAAISFPGPTREEAGGEATRVLYDDGRGLDVEGELASYTVRAPASQAVRIGGELGADAKAWSTIDAELPASEKDSNGASLAVDGRLEAGGSTTVRFILAWYSPSWNAGGYNWADAEHEFTHMYAKLYRDSREVARRLEESHLRTLARITSWQEEVYRDEGLPVWLKDGLVNVLHLITEDGMWAQARPPLPDWVGEDDGLFGMNECPRGCPQIECIPCSFYGNQPLVYFFPKLALSTLRGYRGYQYPDGAPPWIFGGCTGGTPPIDFANPTRGYQFATNGISLATMVDRYYLCYPSVEFQEEFYPVLRMSLVHTIGLRTTESYTSGERIVSMPDPDSRETSTLPTEWFEAPEPGWYGMTAHLALLRLAHLRIVERMAQDAADQQFAERCRGWISEAQEAIEKRLWNGRYYLNYLEPDTGRKSDLVFGYQLDGEWILRQHGLDPVIPADRIETVLNKILESNVAASAHGAVNYTSPDGEPVKVGGYGTYSYFPPEALMLAMTYMYHGQAELGLSLAERVWENIVCRQGYTWDMPNIMRGDEDTGERTFGNDYYQDMMLWSLPAAISGEGFDAPIRPGGLVWRIIQAAKG
jgi:uncharacterized protein (DUF608 family)